MNTDRSHRHTTAPAAIEASRSKLLHTIGDARDVTFLRAWGNIGDELIYAGARQLLATLPYSEVSLQDLQGLHGHTALIAGSGGWCAPYHGMPKYLPLVERRFERVIVLPSSFDVSVPCVREALAYSRAKIFARERQSFDLIKGICDADLAHDCAFFFNFGPYQCQGHGVLTAYRQDKESSGDTAQPGNNDISTTCQSLDEWLWTIARHELIRTDRAHVMIAAAMLGKPVEFRASNYHKLPAIAEYCLKDFPVYPSVEPPRNSDPVEATAKSTAQEQQLPWINEKPALTNEHDWRERSQAAVAEMAGLVSKGDKLILVDEDQLRELLPASINALPFLERDGEYWGPPPDDASAIRELEWLRKNGATMMIIAWPAFWWLSHYTGLHRHLRANFRCLTENDEFIAFQILEHSSVSQSNHQ